MDQQLRDFDDGELLLLPVGQDVGARIPTAATARPARAVRLGATMHELDDSELLVWTLAHGSVAAVRSDTAWRRSSVVEVARFSGLEGPESTVDGLLSKGLLAEVLPGTDSSIEFAKAHRLVPLMLGLGNSSRDPDQYAIGNLGTPVLMVDFPTYDLWQWSAIEDSVWATCEGAADVAGRQNGQHLDADKVLVGFLRSMHSLLVGRCCYLDVRFRLEHPEQR